MSQLSPPEHVADRVSRKRILARLVRDGGCAHCRARTEAWDRAMCSGTAGRVWPLCMKDGQKPEFQLDEETLR